VRFSGIRGLVDRALYFLTEADMARTGKKKVIAELIELLPKLDEEGLTFLLEQARVHLHNMEIDRARQREITAASKTSEGSGSKKRTAAKKGGAAASLFRVERADDGKTYHLVYGEAWKLFTAGEMASMVAIVRAKGVEEELALRLHAWFQRERRDALSDFSLGSAAGPASLELVRVLKKTFSGKK
jgi:hypothetical protein